MAALKIRKINRRITEWIGLEEILEIIYSQLPAKARDIFQMGMLF